MTPITKRIAFILLLLTAIFAPAAAFGVVCTINTISVDDSVVEVTINGTGFCAASCIITSPIVAIETSSGLADLNILSWTATKIRAQFPDSTVYKKPTTTT